MEKTHENVEKDLSRIAELIADIRYAEPPDSLAEAVLGKIKPKKLSPFKRLWRKARTPVLVTPLKLLPVGVSALAILILALSFLWRAPEERFVTQTVNQVTDRGFTVSLIPHTAKVTTLGLKQVGDQVNLESDLIGKYVERLLQERGQLPAKPTPVIDKDYLKKHGLL